VSKIKLKVGDLVKVIAGKDNTKTGKIIRIDHKKESILVEGVNMITKHAKPSAKNQQGGIIHQEGPINVSNAMYLHKGKPTRIGYKLVDGKNGTEKVRVAKSTGEVID
jgi:large subunit ribosomal protein L24